MHYAKFLMLRFSSLLLQFQPNFMENMEIGGGERIESVTFIVNLPTFNNFMAL